MFRKQFQPYRITDKRKFMKYGIWVTQEMFDVYQDGTKKLTHRNQGWRRSRPYEKMSSAKIGLAMAKDDLYDDSFDVSEINSVTVKGKRIGYYYGEPSAPERKEEHVTYHIEKYY